jgi:hypothetical protein
MGFQRTLVRQQVIERTIQLRIPTKADTCSD